VKLVALGGSLRNNSLSTAALRTALGIAQRSGVVDTELCDLREMDLPLYLPEAPIESYPPIARAQITRLVAQYRRADAMLWATPTYHGTVSGAFKNALDYMELLGEEPEPYLQGKAVGLISIADASPLASMATCVTELRAWLAPTRLTLRAADFSDEPGLVSESAKRRLERLIFELLHFCEAPRQPSRRA
jgi:FMN reductase